MNIFQPQTAVMSDDAPPAPAPTPTCEGATRDHEVEQCCDDECLMCYEDTPF